jgi:hypothetical protein
MSVAAPISMNGEGDDAGKIRTALIQEISNKIK